MTKQKIMEECKTKEIVEAEKQGLTKPELVDNYTLSRSGSMVKEEVQPSGFGWIKKKVFGKSYHKEEVKFEYMKPDSQEILLFENIEPHDELTKQKLAEAIV